MIAGVIGEITLFGLRTAALFESGWHLDNNALLLSRVGGYYWKPERCKLAALTPIKDGEVSKIVDASLLLDPSYWPITFVRFSIHHYSKMKHYDGITHRWIVYDSVYVHEYGGFRFSIINGITDSGLLYRLGLETAGMTDIPKLELINDQNIQQIFENHYNIAANQGRASTTLMDLPEFIGR